MLSKRKILHYCLLLIGIFVLTYFLKNFQINEIKGIIQNTKITSLFILTILMSTIVFLKALKWKFLIFNITKKNISLQESIYNNLSGIASSLIIPGRADVAKSIELSKNHDISLSRSISLCFLDRAIEFLAIIMIIGISLIIRTNIRMINSNLIKPLLIMFILIIIICYLFKHKNFKEKMIHFISKKIDSKHKNNIIIKKIKIILEDIKILQKNKDKFIFQLILSILWMVSGIAILQISLQNVGIYISFQSTAIALTLSLIIGLLSFIPGGIGITETSLQEILIFLSKEAITVNISTPIILARIFSLYLPALIGTIILLIGILKKK